ncbi:DUF1146 family protein [Paenibacillus xylaniclasticus]|uniref:DUF1146 family protein n=1 Tax=Paenibacillus xylaniclasticus TaxID=588083 RepID=UPI001776C067|nr:MULTISPECIES: DUF1146 domain-containing protein [Paenibacillus]GFN32690.1 hypothetical protein PCURB6_29500 [Paenibacillus curdlanolyticus]
MNMEDIELNYAVNGLLSIVVVLLSIILAWTVLQELKLDAFLRHPRAPKARLLLIVLAVVIGHSFASFILDYFEWTRMLSGFVE